jgi:hypothetical protein
MITHILVISLCVFSIWYVMQPGEIFGWLGNILSRILPAWLHDPAFECPVCMTAWYGSGIYYLFFFNGSWQDWVLTVIGAMGLNVVILKLAPEKGEVSTAQTLGEASDKYGPDTVISLPDRIYKRHPDVTDIGDCDHPKKITGVVFRDSKGRFTKS